LYGSYWRCNTSGTNDYRRAPDVEYEYLYQEALDLAKYTDATITKPRTAERQLKTEKCTLTIVFV
jgi:hypothetical protein